MQDSERHVLVVACLQAMQHAVCVGAACTNLSRLSHCVCCRDACFLASKSASGFLAAVPISCYNHSLTIKPLIFVKPHLCQIAASVLVRTVNPGLGFGVQVQTLLLLASMGSVP